MAATFSAGGLASGLDTNSIIDKFVQLRTVPLTQLQKTQAGAQAKVSTLADITARIADFETAARALASGGVLGSKAVNQTSAFKAVPGTGAVAGEYAIQVQTLAQSAKARSLPFAATDLVRGGTLALKVQGISYDVTVPDGTSLQDLAALIRQTGAPVSAAVLSDGTSSYLSLSSLTSGFPTGGVAGDALSLVETSSGVLGKALGASVFQQAQNASFLVDGLQFTRQSNQVSDAIPGTTLTLATQGGPVESLSIAYDAEATTAKLKTFVDAYNRVMSVVQRQLAVTPQTDRSATLAGDMSMRSLQTRLQGLVSSTVGGLSSVRTLADLGVKTSTDGSLQIDATTLAGAMARDPSSVNGMFSTASSGLGALTSSLASDFTGASTGVLTVRTTSLKDQVKEMDSQAIRLQASLDAYRTLLVAQFSAMETLVSSLKNSANYLTAMTASTNTK
jgi:flagellar hook-associated protein 2